MLEVALASAAGCLLLAAASHRYRQEAGAVRPGDRRLLRIGGAALLLLAAVLAAGPLSGERAVRFLGGFAVGGVALVLALSFHARIVLAPVRLLLARRR